jgi:hypothetical protein
MQLANPKKGTPTDRRNPHQYPENNSELLKAETSRLSIFSSTRA